MEVELKRCHELAPELSDTAAALRDAFSAVPRTVEELVDEDKVELRLIVARLASVGIGASVRDGYMDSVCFAFARLMRAIEAVLMHMCFLHNFQHNWNRQLAEQTATVATLRTYLDRLKACTGATAEVQAIFGGGPGLPAAATLTATLAAQSPFAVLAFMLQGDTHVAVAHARAAVCAAMANANRGLSEATRMSALATQQFATAAKLLPTIATTLRDALTGSATVPAPALFAELLHLLTSAAASTSSGAGAATSAGADGATAPDAREPSTDAGSEQIDAAVDNERHADTSNGDARENDDDEDDGVFEAVEGEDVAIDADSDDEDGAGDAEEEVLKLLLSLDGTDVA